MALASTLACTFATLSAPAWGQAAPAPDQGIISSPAATTEAEDPAALNAELFYDILVGEMAAGAGDPGSGHALMLSAARQSNSAQLYRRATDLALMARAGNQALASAQEWLQAFPESRNANRYVLQILVALNRIRESTPYLRREVDAVAAPNKPAAFLSITQLYSRASNKEEAAEVVQAALQGSLKDPTTGPSAWATVGHMYLVAGNHRAALEAVQQAEALSPGQVAAALLALELLESGHAAAEPIVARYVEKHRGAEMRLAYARVLLAQDRPAPAEAQLMALTREHPDYADAWLTLAKLQVQAQHWQVADQALQRYDGLIAGAATASSQRAARAESYLLHALIAQKQGRLADALAWVERIDDGAQRLDVQVRRASLLAQQGALEQARAALQAVPAGTEAQQRLKVQAEVQLLRDADQLPQAYELQTTLQQQYPNDSDIAYETALLAERIGRDVEMEERLRALIQRDPGYYHALNALGYALAERGERLDEAYALIRQALARAPDNPFITDSLGWVEFRRGNLQHAQALLEKAFAARPDAEIAAHLGEVLWVRGQQDRARAVWQRGLEQGPDNATLRETLRRLGVTP